MPVEDDDVEDDDDESFSVEDDDADEETDDDADDDEEDDTPKTKTVTSTVDWESRTTRRRSGSGRRRRLILRSTKFYRALSKDDTPPLTYTHFKAEGDVEFKSILFVPERAPHDMFDNYYNKAAAPAVRAPRVHLGRVREPLPKYLSFIKGIVDSIPCP